MSELPNRASAKLSLIHILAADLVADHAKEVAPAKPPEQNNQQTTDEGKKAA